MYSKFKWHFPSTQGGDEDGINDPLRENFEGQYEHYVARESIQNSLDARVDAGAPVVVRFERWEAAAQDIPGLEELRSVLERARAYSEGQEKASNFFEEAFEVLASPKIPVLRVSDTNTTGLDGSDQDKTGGWYRLIRASGSNSMHGVGGGSFGIGKGAPFAASSLRFVLYSTLNTNGEVAFQGKARLCSFEDEQGDIRRGVGQLGIPGGMGVVSSRNADEIPPHYVRAERGTDVFIVGYKGSHEKWQQRLLTSVLENFWAAIHFGDLVVELADEDVEFVLSEANLDETLRSSKLFQQVLPYYEAVHLSTKQFENDDPLLGRSQLFVRVARGGQKKVQLMRSAKMKVCELSFRVLTEPFAAVFICDDPKGNALLRGLEPPAHDSWDTSRDPLFGQKAMHSIKTFIRDSLRSMSPVADSSPQDIPELSKYLPQSEGPEDHTHGSKAGATEEVTEFETGEASQVPSDGDLRRLETKKGEKVRVPKVKVSGGDEGGRFGSKKGKPKKGNNPPEEGPGGLRALIDPDLLTFRSRERFVDGERIYVATIHPDATQEGNLSFFAVGEVGDALIPLQSAKIVGGDELRVDGPSILNLSLVENQPVKIELRFKSPRRYVLDIA